ncbi:MAG: ABC transporter ATP-binding protein [Verrucomicrobia bacterium]|nr:ABC transporter ATP-binding protein [Verrucomicrobiota bacterium]
MSDLILEAGGVAKAFGSGSTRIPVLRTVDLALAAGESLAIRGESGSGKSTLLHLLAGLDVPDAGWIRWGAAAPDPARRSRYLGLVFQSFHLVPELDALGNVLLAARILGAPDAATRQRAESLLGQVGLAGRARHLPAQLSGGERQRVAVARALINRPRLLLADEPTGNLDEHTGEAVIDLLVGLCAATGTALVLVTHNAAHAARCRGTRTLHEGVLR